MAGQDFRVPIAALLRAFGVAATVTRPSPDDDPVETEVIWLPLETMEVPAGSEFPRSESRRAMGIPKRDVPTVPLGTEVLAPEKKGGSIVGWKVDGMLHPEVDDHRVVVLRAPELDP